MKVLKICTARVILEICLLATSYCLVSANEWILSSSHCKYNNVEMVSSLYKASNVSSSSKKSSYFACSSWCCTLSADFFVYNQRNSSCECNDGILLKLDVDSSRTSGVFVGETENKIEIFDDGDYERYLVTPEKQDCLELYQGGYRTNGVYQIRQPSGEAVDVWCDMADGGWTVILRRQDGSEDFNRGWDEYVNGFGNLSGEYWLGLESIHLLTVHDSSLKVYADTFGDVTPPTMYAVYDSVAVQDVFTNYRLEVSGFSGDCGDSLSYNNNMPFTTLDRDNDQHTGTNCAAQASGGWWYDACHSTSPTGRYMNGAFSDDFYAKAMVWYECWGHHYSPKSFIIKIRRN